ncbi:hypothetical protein [Vibrio ichthyoenteri]|nr:hypothetical protein [Vibrio ichthyoenteri]
MSRRIGKFVTIDGKSVTIKGVFVAELSKPVTPEGKFVTER